MGKIIYIYACILFRNWNIWNIFANFLIRRRVDVIINN